MHKAGASCLALDAEKCLMLDKEAVIASANEAGSPSSRKKTTGRVSRNTRLAAHTSAPRFLTNSVSRSTIFSGYLLFEALLWQNHFV